MVYADRMRRTLTGRAGDWLARNSRPRLLVLGTYAVAAFIAWQVSVSLAQLGMSDTAIRFACCFVIAWLSYSTIVGVWLRHMPVLDHETLMRDAPSKIVTSSPDEGPPEWLELAAEEAKRAIQRDARSVLGLVVTVAILGVLFLLGHWLLYSRWYLGELMVVAGKVSHRSVQNVASHAWIVEPFRQSFWLAFGLLVHFVVIGMLLQLRISA